MRAVSKFINMKIKRVVRKATMLIEEINIYIYIYIHTHYTHTHTHTYIYIYIYIYIITWS